MNVDLQNMQQITYKQTTKNIKSPSEVPEVVAQAFNQSQNLGC
jgi:hypothetical protein